MSERRYREYAVRADADWRVFSASFTNERRFYIPPLLYRDDIEEYDEGWSDEYQNHPADLLGVPVELCILAKDELDAFAEAQAWLDKAKERAGGDTT